MEGRAEGLSTSRSAWMLLSFHAGREELLGIALFFILIQHRYVHLYTAVMVQTFTQKDCFK